MRSTRSSTTRRSSSRLPTKPPRSCRSCSYRTASSRCRDFRGPRLDHAGTGRAAQSGNFLRPLAYELAGLADYGDVDIARARPVSRSVGHVDAAQVEAIQGLQGRDQLLPRRLWAGAPQALDQNLGSDEPLHGGIGGSNVLVAGDGALEFLDDRYGGREREGRNLADGDAGPVLSEVLDEGVRAVVRKGYEERALAGLLQLLDECDARVGQDRHDHRLRLGFCDRCDRFLDFYRSARVARDGDGGHVFFFHCLLHPGQAVLAE